MTDLDLIAQLEGKIQQLPPQIAIEINDYVDFLLQKYQTCSLQKQQEILQYPVLFPSIADKLKKNKSLLGCLHQYANSELIPEEAHAWRNSLGTNDDYR